MTSRLFLCKALVCLRLSLSWRWMDVLWLTMEREQTAPFPVVEYGCLVKLGCPLYHHRRGDIIGHARALPA